MYAIVVDSKLSLVFRLFYRCSVGLGTHESSTYWKWNIWLSKLIKIAPRESQVCASANVVYSFVRDARSNCRYRIRSEHFPSRDDGISPIIETWSVARDCSRLSWYVVSGCSVTRCLLSFYCFVWLCSSCSLGCSFLSCGTLFLSWRFIDDDIDGFFFRGVFPAKGGFRRIVSHESSVGKSCHPPIIQLIVQKFLVRTSWFLGSVSWRRIGFVERAHIDKLILVV